MSRAGGFGVGPGWMRPQRLEYVPLDDELAVVRVTAGLRRGLTPPADAALVAGTAHTILRAPVLGGVTHRASRRRTADHLLWRATFALPLELVEAPQTLFALVAREHMPTRLPEPTLASLEALCRHWELGPRGAWLLSGLAWRRAAAVGSALAVTGGSVFPPAAAFASSGHATRGTRRAHTIVHHSRLAAPRAHIAAAATSSKTSASTTAGSLAGTTATGATASTAVSSDQVTQTGGLTGASTSEHSSGHHRHVNRKHRAKHRHHGHHHRSGGAATPVAPGATSSTPASSPGSLGAQGGTSSQASAPPAVSTTPTHRHHGAGSGDSLTPGIGSGVPTLSPTPPAGLIHSYGSGSHSVAGNHAGSGLRHGTGHHPAVEHHHHRTNGGHGKFSGGGALPTFTHKPKTQSAPPSAPAPADEAETTGSTNGIWTAGTGSSSSEAALLSRLSGLFSTGMKPPSFLIPIYQKAGHRFHIPWQVLAAINSVETNYGRDLSVSSAGAEGWMQFEPSTWAQYGMSVNGKGLPNPYDPTDAIFSAARYLAANGGAHHLRQAIFAYNHAGWYVDEVMWRAEQILQHTARPDADAKGKIEAMLTAARLLNGLPYVYGGGHAGWGPSIGYDCSGFVSAVLHAAGYLAAPQDTQTLPDQPGILPGPGKWVTMYDRTDGGSLSEDHVIIDIDGHFWESGGSSSEGGGAMVHPIADISLAYLATFNRILHPRGL